MARSPKTRKLPRSSQSRPTLEFVTGAYTHSIQDLRAFARNDMDELVDNPALADRALQIALVHKDVHLANRIMDAGGQPRHRANHASNAFSSAVDACCDAQPEMRRALERIVDRMLDAGPQWAYSMAAQNLDRSSPARWRQSLIEEVKSLPLGVFHGAILLHCLEVPEAVKALLDKGAVWDRSQPGSVEMNLAQALHGSQYPLDVLNSLEMVKNSTRPNHAPGSNRLARRRSFAWEAVLAMNPMPTASHEWFDKFHEQVGAWAAKHARVDVAKLALNECALSPVWPYSERERIKLFGIVSDLVSNVWPANRSRPEVAMSVASLALSYRDGQPRRDAARFLSDIESLVISMVDEMGFAAPDLSALPNAPTTGRLHSFCMSKAMAARVKPIQRAAAGPSASAPRPRF